MHILTRVHLVVLVATLYLAGCSGGDGHDPADQGTSQDAAADGQRPDDAALRSDATGLPDGAVIAPDGAIIAPDGAVLEPDGAVLQPDGAVPVHGNDAGPFCGARDAGLADLPDASCTSGACLKQLCSNGFKDQYETDIDCGGVCSPCATGQRCSAAADCASTACSARFCQNNLLDCDRAICLPTAPAITTQITLPVTAVVRNPHDGVVFASLGAQTSGVPGAVVAFAPGDTTPSYSISLPGAGGALAITDDGAKLYVAVGGTTPSIARIDIASRVVETPFPVGKNRSGSTLYAASLAAVPGHPEQIGVVFGAVTTEVGGEGLDVFRDGVRTHPNQNDWLGNTQFGYVQVSAAVFTSDTHAYAVDGATSAATFQSVDISATAVHISAVHKGIVNDFNVEPTFVAGKMFIGDRVVDPTIPRVLGGVRSLATAAAVDDDASHAYYPLIDGEARVIGVECFDTRTYARSGAVVFDITLPEGLYDSVSFPEIDLWGSDGLAVRVNSLSSARLILAPHALHGVAGCEPGVAPTAPTLLSAADAHDDIAQTYCIHVTETAYAPTADMIYATVSEDDLRFANTLVGARISAGGLAFATPVGSDPGPLAVSDDASMAWVGQSKAGFIASVDLNHPSAVQQYPTALSANDQVALVPEDLALLPGSKDTLAVTAYALGQSPLNVYDHGVARYTDAASNGSTDPLTAYSLAVGDASHVYITSGNNLSEVSLSPTSRTVDWTLPRMAYPLQLANGKLFDGSLVVDAAQHQLLGGIPQNQSYPVPTVIAPDAAHAYRASYASASPPGKTRVQVQCFDLRTFSQSGVLTLDLPDAPRCAHTGNIRLGMIGSGGLTFASDEALVIAPDVLNCVPGCSVDSAPPVYTPPALADAKDAAGKVLAYKNIVAADLEHDPKSGTLFVSVGDTDARTPNNVLAFDASGALQYAVAVGSNPGPLATSEDGSKLYVALDRAAQIVTLDLASHAVTPFQRLDPQVGVGTGQVYPAPNDLEVVPGAPDTLVATAVQLSDGSWARPLLIQAGSVDYLEGSTPAIPDPAASLLPIDAHTTWLASSFLLKVTRASDGSVMSSSVTNTSGFIKRLVPVGKDRFASDAGQIFDAQTGAVLGTMSAHGGVIASDDGTKVYVVSSNGSSFTLGCFDGTTAKQTGTSTLTLPTGYTFQGDTSKLEIELLGARGLAMRGTDLLGGGSLVLYPSLFDSVPGC